MNLETAPQMPAPTTIILKGEISEKWLHAYQPLTMNTIGDTTMIILTVDQAALRGLLNHLWDFNVTLCSIACQRPEDQEPGGPDG